MKKVITIIFLSLILITITGCNIKGNKNFSYRFANREEAIQLYLSNEEYFNNFSTYDIQYRTNDINGTIDTLKEFGCKQMREFSDGEKQTLTDAMNEIETILKDNNYHLPSTDEIIFVKSSQKEELGATAYTHGSQIYMDNYIPSLLSSSEKGHNLGIKILTHELFHCLTRNNSDFRQQMYKLINFTVEDDDFEIPKDIKNISIINPDVEHHNAYATFTINNQKKDCYFLNIAIKPFESKYDKLTSYYKTILIPINKTDNDKDYYFIEEADDFWDVMSENTKYVTDPEECMADNFALAIIDGINDPGNYDNPNIIQGIIDIIKK